MQSDQCQEFREPGVTPSVLQRKCSDWSIWAEFSQGSKWLPLQHQGICPSADLFCCTSVLMKNRKNKFLPSSPRRLTSSWDNSLRCFSASSLCRGKKKNNPNIWLLVIWAGHLPIINLHVFCRKTRGKSKQPRYESFRITVLLLQNTQMFFCC